MKILTHEKSDGGDNCVLNEGTAIVGIDEVLNVNPWTGHIRYLCIPLHECVAKSFGEVYLLRELGNPQVLFQDIFQTLGLPTTQIEYKTLDDMVFDPYNRMSTSYEKYFIDHNLIFDKKVSRNALLNHLMALGKTDLTFTFNIETYGKL